ncbi:HFL022Wp [Eremothecium sinecaudum]|uniref:HFL022Wp n=1 Tax=Eremothecium sinecaudum TaxID=45286 RepID=A0A0X8HUU4_9SACH|nr:HFL022Wp [Eremothecium sinecaudum]AMD21834.1 HFL022Wp [Eremothecium sinecaudum]
MMVGNQILPMENLIPFDDTYVLYDPTDPISYFSCYFSLLPIAILIFYFSWFVTTREVEPAFIAVGHIINDVLNNIAKNVIKEPRPYNFGTFQRDTLRSGFGMPSAHSQFMGFFAIYLGLRIWLQWAGLKYRRKVMASVALVLATLSVASSRVYLGYHNVSQVSVGVVLGMLLGSNYFICVGFLRNSGISDWILSWPICRWLLIKDSTFYSSTTLRDEYEAYWKRRNAKYNNVDKEE